MVKNCVECNCLIDSGDIYYATTMLCNNCYLQGNQNNNSKSPSKSDNKVKKEWLETLEKTGGNLADWHCNNCYLSIKECACGDRMLPVPIEK